MCFFRLPLLVLVLASALLLHLPQSAVNCKRHSFTSTDKLVSVFQVFHNVTRVLVEFANERDLADPWFSKLIESYVQVNGTKPAEQKRFLSNPVNAFVFIRMLTDDLENRLPLLTDHSYLIGERLKSLGELYEDEKPTADDFDGAVAAINRLIDAYLYTIDDVVVGRFNETSRSLFPLDASDCYELAKNSMKARDFHLTYAWANQSMKFLDEDPAYPFLKKRQVYHLLSELALRQKNPHAAYMFLKQISVENPEDHKARQQLEQFVVGLEKLNATINDGRDKQLVTKRDVDEIDPTILKYEALCRDDQTVLKPVKPLFCRYVNDHPYLLIGPVKEEKIYDDPPMWIFYDTLTERQAQYLQEMGLPKLTRAKVGTSNSSRLSPIRITQSYFFEEEENDEDETIEYLDYLVEAVTKLSVMEAEPWQIANYGVGGQYEPHHDHHGNNTSESSESGDRFATWLNYVEAPDIGGDTVFVELGIKTKALSRSSVLWYNLGKDLSGDARTLHAACPVVLGSKWINNKWIHQHDQMFTKPCPAN